MTDVTKVGVPNPQTTNRPNSPQKNAEDGGKTDAKGKSGEAARTGATFRLPEALAEGKTGPQTAADALKAVFDSLSKAFSDLESKPPTSGTELEDLLSDIKVAAPLLDRVLAARKEEILADGDKDGLAALDKQLADAEAQITEAQAGFERVAGGLPDEAAAEDPAVTQALNAILGEGREIPAFSAEELREGRQEFIAFVFEDMADAVGRHRSSGAQQASYTLGTLGGANLTA